MKRRTLLAGAAAALVVTPAAAICQAPAAIADPASAFVGAYRTALAAWYELPSDKKPDMLVPSFEDDPIPVPTSSKGAQDLLRLLIEDVEESSEGERYSMIAEAVLAYLERTR
jgi:hypothetical protein